MPLSQIAIKSYIPEASTGIGIYWELEECGLRKYKDSLEFGRNILEACKSFCPSPNLINANVYVDICEQEHVKSLSSLGYKVVALDKAYPLQSNAFIASILFWLLDCDSENQQSFVNLLVFIVTSNIDILPTLGLLKSRKVQVVVVIDSLITNRAAWEAVATVVIDVTELGSYCEKNVDEYRQTNSPKNCISIDYAPPTAAQYRYQEVSICDDIHDNSDEHTTDEQRTLQQDLARAFRTKNVQVAVSTLRKIYTKQNKGFRIPTILINIAQQNHLLRSREAETSAHMEAAFLVGCIQWCFGGQKGDNIETFTYKMNKNIARWLLKEIQRNELTQQELKELTPHVLTVIQNILRQVPELELALDLLNIINLSEPVNFMAPFILSWNESPNPMVVERVRCFAKVLGVRIDSLKADLGGSSIPSLVADMHDNPITTIQGKHIRSSTNDVSKVHQRLLSILEKSPYGVLGARIPDIYATQYGEPLQLRNRKLKDVLRDLNGVEMVGSDGPGDKLFRLVDNNKYSQREQDFSL